MGMAVTLLLLVPMTPARNYLPEILSFHSMIANKLLRAPIQRRIVVYEAEFHGWSRGIAGRIDEMGLICSVLVTTSFSRGYIIEDYRVHIL